MNVLFISSDHQHQWRGTLGGHPLTMTPYLDWLATWGATLLPALCQAPLGYPSRTSRLLGLRPMTTGV